jgi:hypothetical protein
MLKSFIVRCFAIATVFVMAAPAAFSQTANVSWGPVHKEPKRSATVKIIGSDKSGFYTLRNDMSSVSLFNLNGQKIFLERYDTNNKIVFSKELIVPVPVKTKTKYKFEDIFYLQGQLIMFASFLDKDAGENTAFATRVSSTGEVDEHLVEVASFGDAKKRNPGEFGFTISNDSSKILVFQNLPYERRLNEKFQFKVLDNQLSTVFSKAVTLPKLDKDTWIGDYRVDNDGSVYLMASMNKSKEERSSKEQKFNTKVFGYFTDGQSKEYDIRIPNKFLTEMTFNLDKKRDLIIAGFYADDKRLRSSGTFFLRLDHESKKVISQGVKDFSKEFLENFMSKTKAKNENAGIANMSLDQLIVREDGGAVLVAEQAYMYVVTNRTKYGTTYTYHYINNDIVFVNINPDGTIQWVSRVPKKQHTINDGAAYSSYSVSVMQDKIYLIYNDHVKNIGKDDPKKFKQMKKPQKAVTMLVAMDNTGKFQRKALFPARDHKTIVRPSFYLQGDDNVIIYSETGREYRYGNIKFSNTEGQGI